MPRPTPTLGLLLLMILLLYCSTLIGYSAWNQTLLESANVHARQIAAANQARGEVDALQKALEASQAAMLQEMKSTEIARLSDALKELQEMKRGRERRGEEMGTCLLNNSSSKKDTIVCDVTTRIHMKANLREKIDDEEACGDIALMLSRACAGPFILLGGGMLPEKTS